MFYTVFLQAPAGGGGGGMQSLIFLLLIFAVFYFFMIRPQMRKQKDAQKYRDGIQKGDKIVTIGGAHGTIVEVADTTILVEVDSGVKIRYEKSAVSPEATKALAEGKGKDAKK
ncbi:MAG: preprotein translocase subunit YajC [Bacteroidia bacterium]|nr:preprotein translocase subunit YajC [Bacteroidia bacterium]